MPEGLEAPTRTASEDRPAVFALDRDWRFTYLNDEAERIFEERGGALRGDSVWPWIDDEVRDIYRETFEAALENGEPMSAEVHCPQLQRWFHVQTYPQREGVSVHLREMDGRLERERELKRRERALRHAHEVTTDRDASTREKIRRLLGVIRGTLGTEVGLLSRRDPETDTFELLCVEAEDGAPVEAGERPPPEQTLTCSEVVRTKQTLVIHDIEQQAPDLVGEADLGTYIGAPIHVDGEAFGTFCFFSAGRRSEGFDEWEITYVDMFADWVGAAIEDAGGLDTDE